MKRTVLTSKQNSNSLVFKERDHIKAKFTWGPDAVKTNLVSMILQILTSKILLCGWLGTSSAGAEAAVPVECLCCQSSTSLDAGPCQPRPRLPTPLKMQQELLQIQCHGISQLAAAPAPPWACASGRLAPPAHCVHPGRPSATFQQSHTEQCHQDRVCLCCFRRATWAGCQNGLHNRCAALRLCQITCIGQAQCCIKQLGLPGLTNKKGDSVSYLHMVLLLGASPWSFWG